MSSQETIYQQSSETFFRVIISRLTAAELFRSSRLYYSIKFISLISILIATQYILLKSPDSNWRFPLIICWALVTGIIGTIGHDAGHGAFSTYFSLNNIICLISMPLINGNSLKEWRMRHLLHHKYLQIASRDPDATLRIPQFSYNDKSRIKRRLALLIDNHPVFIFWSLSAFYVFIKRATSLRHALKNPHKFRGEIFCITGHYLLLLLLPITVLGLQGAVNYAVYSIILSVYYSLIFSVNHMGRMVEYPDTARDITPEYIIEHTRSINTNPVIDFLFGSLTLHTAHHLFPHLGANRLKEVNKIISEVSREFNIQYRQLKFFAALREVNIHLKENGLNHSDTINSPEANAL